MGKGKVATLTKIKDFNKQINLLKWQCRYLSTMVTHLDERYLDFHMLRVTKDLQAFLRGGAGVDRHKIGLEKAEKTFEYVKRAHITKMKKINTARRKLEKSVRQKEAENERLKAHVIDLQKNVEVRSSIHRARMTSQRSNDAGSISR